MSTNLYPADDGGGDRIHWHHYKANWAIKFHNVGKYEAKNDGTTPA